MKRTCGQGLWVLAALGLAAILARPAAAGMGFSEPKALNSNALTDSGDDYLPDIAGDGHGVWIAVWYTFDGLGGTLGTDGDILYVRSADNGATWSNPAPIHNNAATDSGVDTEPRIMTDGAGVWLCVWYSRENLGGAIGTDEDIFFVRSVDNGLTWSSVAVLNSSASNSVFDGIPVPATDRQGNWIVTWSSFDHLDRITSPNFNILYSRSADNGATWTPAAVLTAGVGDDRRSGIATDRAGTWIISWASTDSLAGTIGTDWDILFSKSTDNGMTWTAAASLNINAATDSGADGQLPYGLAPYGPVIAGDADTFICVWGSNDSLGGTIGTDGDILYARSTDKGGTWSYPAPLNSQAFNDPQDATGADFNPHIATDRNGTWICAWTTAYFSAPLHSDYDIAISRSRDAGLTWTPISALDSYAATDFEGWDELPRVASDETGEWAVAWDARHSFFTGSDDDPLVAMSGSILDPPDPPLTASKQDLVNVIVDIILGKKIVDQNGDGVIDVADILAAGAKSAPSAGKEGKRQITPNSNAGSSPPKDGRSGNPLSSPLPPGAGAPSGSTAH